MTPDEPQPPVDPRLFQKVPVPPELIEWAKAQSTAEEVAALLAEAQAEGGVNSIEPILAELEARYRSEE